MPRTADTPGSSYGVTTTSGVAVADNPARQELIVVNDSDTTIYLRLDAGAAVAHQGIRLNPNGGECQLTEYSSAGCYSGPVSAIHDNKDALGATTTGTTKNVCYVEV